MELSLDKLSRNKDLRAESLHAFIQGLAQLDLATIQHGFTGSVVPWSQLVKFNHTHFPMWNESSVDGFLELSGEFLASVDKSFNSEMHKLLDLERNRSIVFDLTYARETLPTNTLSFLYNSGLIAWYVQHQPEEEMHTWLLSVRDANTLCIFNRFKEKYVVLDVNNSEAVDIQPENYKDILNLLCRHVIWHRQDEYEFTCNQLEHLETHISELTESLKDIYEVSLVFGQLRLVRIGGVK